MQFDMKQALFYFVDGYSNTGTVNLPAGYAPGTSSMTISGIIGLIPVGVTFQMPAFNVTGTVNLMAGYTTGTMTMVVDGIASDIPIGTKFTLAGDDTIYTINAVVNTLGATTSITFTPGLQIAAVDDEVISFSSGNDDTIYTVSAQTPTAGNTTSITFVPTLVDPVNQGDVITFGGRMLKMKIGDGTMTADEKRIVEYKKDRGTLDTVRLGDQEPMEVKLQIRWEFLYADVTDPTTSSVPSPEDVLKQRGLASNWLTTSADPCEPYCVDIYVIYTPLCPGIKKESYRLQMYRWETLNHDFKQGMLDTTGKCNVQQMLVTRFPQQS